MPSKEPENFLGSFRFGSSDFQFLLENSQDKNVPKNNELGGTSFGAPNAFTNINAALHYAEDFDSDKVGAATGGSKFETCPLVARILLSMHRFASRTAQHVFSFYRIRALVLPCFQRSTVTEIHATVDPSKPVEFLCALLEAEYAYALTTRARNLPQTEYLAHAGLLLDGDGQVLLPHERVSDVLLNGATVFFTYTLFLPISKLLEFGMLGMLGMPRDLSQQAVGCGTNVAVLQSSHTNQMNLHQQGAASKANRSAHTAIAQASASDGSPVENPAEQFEKPSNPSSGGMADAGENTGCNFSAGGAAAASFANNQAQAAGDCQNAAPFSAPNGESLAVRSLKLFQSVPHLVPIVNESRMLYSVLQNYAALSIFREICMSCCQLHYLLLWLDLEVTIALQNQYASKLAQQMYQENLMSQHPHAEISEQVNMASDSNNNNNNNKLKQADLGIAGESDKKVAGRDTLSVSGGPAKSGMSKGGDIESSLSHEHSALMKKPSQVSRKTQKNTSSLISPYVRKYLLYIEQIYLRPSSPLYVSVPKDIYQASDATASWCGDVQDYVFSCLRTVSFHHFQRTPIYAEMVKLQNNNLSIYNAQSLTGMFGEYFKGSLEIMQDVQKDSEHFKAPNSFYTVEKYLNAIMNCFFPTAAPVLGYAGALARECTKKQLIKKFSEYEQTLDDRERWFHSEESRQKREAKLKAFFGVYEEKPKVGGGVHLPIAQTNSNSASTSSSQSGKKSKQDGFFPTISPFIGTSEINSAFWEDKERFPSNPRFKRMKLQGSPFGDYSVESGDLKILFEANSFEEIFAKAINNAGRGSSAHAFYRGNKAGNVKLTTSNGGLQGKKGGSKDGGGSDQRMSPSTTSSPSSPVRELELSSKKFVSEGSLFEESSVNKETIRARREKKLEQIFGDGVQNAKILQSQKLSAVHASAAAIDLDEEDDVDEAQKKNALHEKVRRIFTVPVCHVFLTDSQRRLLALKHVSTVLLQISRKKNGLDMIVAYLLKNDAEIRVLAMNESLSGNTQLLNLLHEVEGEKEQNCYKGWGTAAVPSVLEESVKFSKNCHHSSSAATIPATSQADLHCSDGTESRASSVSKLTSTFTSQFHKHINTSKNKKSNSSENNRSSFESQKSGAYISGNASTAATATEHSDLQNKKTEDIKDSNDINEYTDDNTKGINESSSSCSTNGSTHYFNSPKRKEPLRDHHDERTESSNRSEQGGSSKTNNNNNNNNNNSSSPNEGITERLQRLCLSPGGYGSGMQPIRLIERYILEEFERRVEEEFMQKQEHSAAALTILQDLERVRSQIRQFLKTDLTPAPSNLSDSESNHGDDATGDHNQHHQQKQREKRGDQETETQEVKN